MSTSTPTPGSAPAPATTAAPAGGPPASPPPAAAGGGGLPPAHGNAKANEFWLLVVGVVLVIALIAVEATIRAVAGNSDELTFFPPSATAAGIALFMPLAFSPNPWVNIRWRRAALALIKFLAILLGFAGLALWAAALAWSINPHHVPVWSQMVFAHTQLFDWTPVTGRGCNILCNQCVMRLLSTRSDAMNVATTVLTQTLPVLLVVPGAAIVGWVLGRLLRGPRTKRPLEVARTKDFAVKQASGVVRGSKTVLSSPETHQPVEEVYVVHIPAGMPQEQRVDSIQQASAA